MSRSRRYHLEQNPHFVKLGGLSHHKWGFCTKTMIFLPGTLLLFCWYYIDCNVLDVSSGDIEEMKTFKLTPSDTGITGKKKK
jgi:hypothetical protein